MMEPILIRDIIRAIEEKFPPSWQEGFDNTGLQVGEEMRPCHGVLICVDATPAAVVEAYEKGYNLIITHHPLIFHPLKSITGYDRVTRTIRKAILHDVTVYSCHTPVDKAPGGISAAMAKSLGLLNVEMLDQEPDGKGYGVVGDLPGDFTHSPAQFARAVGDTFGCAVPRTSSLEAAPANIRRVALCGGAGAFLIEKAIGAGADAFIASDCKHNQFIDHADQLLLVDIGHYEAEKCAKEIFYNVIEEKFPNFAIHYSQSENNPINYI